MNLIYTQLPTIDYNTFKYVNQSVPAPVYLKIRSTYTHINILYGAYGLIRSYMFKSLVP